MNNGEVEFTDLAQGLIAIAKIMQEMRDSILTNIPKDRRKYIESLSFQKRTYCCVLAKRLMFSNRC